MLLSVYAESSSTRVGSPSRTVALSTPSPSMSGISWSTRATSGFSRRIASIAVRPSSASATTSIRPLIVRPRLTPSRKKGWSSATTTRTRASEELTRRSIGIVGTPWCNLGAPHHPGGIRVRTRRDTDRSGPTPRTGRRGDRRRARRARGAAAARGPRRARGVRRGHGAGDPARGSPRRVRRGGHRLRPRRARRRGVGARRRPHRRALGVAGAVPRPRGPHPAHPAHRDLRTAELDGVRADHGLPARPGARLGYAAAARVRRRGRARRAGLPGGGHRDADLERRAVAVTAAAHARDGGRRGGVCGPVVGPALAGGDDRPAGGGPGPSARRAGPTGGGRAGGAPPGGARPRAAGRAP